MEQVKIQGIVQTGMKRGKKLGFPTVNFPIEPTIPEGIYLSLIEISGKSYNSLTFIGAARTFNEDKYNAETYILNFNSDIYGELVTVSLLKKIRDNQKFASEEELIAQMEKDKKEAEEFFKP